MSQTTAGKPAGAIEEPTGTIKNVISWASVSYGIGFTIVMLHTGRLGFPVLELLSAIYVWIGIPVTIFIFFALKLGKRLRNRSIEIAEGLKESWKELRADYDERELNLLYEFVGIFDFIVPFSSILRPLFVKFIERIFLRASAAEGAEEATKKANKIIRRIACVTRGIKAVQSGLRIIGIVLLSLLLVYIYVWHLYPKIPQKYGGGAPLSARIIVDVEKIPSETPFLEIKPYNQSKNTKAQITSPLKILYMAKDQIFVETRKGGRISFSRGSINGVVWLEKDLKTGKLYEPGQEQLHWQPKA